MRFELLKIYLWLSGRGKLVAACQEAQWERGHNCPCLKAAVVRNTVELNVLHADQLDKKYKGYLG